MFGGCYRARRVLVTGHTGFKGSWLALWLKQLGAHVAGVALPPETTPNHWALLSMDMESRDIDIRDAAALRAAVGEFDPEVVFHLAAQSLVRPSYLDPLRTWSTNVMGTAHLLEACRFAKALRSVVVVTSDKCYENLESGSGYSETDRLGGHDPYSASKAGAELVAASYRRSFFGASNSPLVATARAGNVIGGGDWSDDRLIPDLVRAIREGRPLQVRSPGATRPWQHVLESLSGYLVLGQQLLEGNAGAASAWNFGPAPADTCTVGEVLSQLQGHWPAVAWAADSNPHPHETTTLRLDSRKAMERLRWKPVWKLDDALASTARWYQAYLQDGHIRSLADVEAYEAAARAQCLPWAVA